MTDSKSIRKWFFKAFSILFAAGLAYVALQPEYNMGLSDEVLLLRMRHFLVTQIIIRQALGSVANSFLS